MTSQRIYAALFVTMLGAACASNRLHSETTNQRQPVVTQRGPVGESTGDKIIADVGGADTKSEKDALVRLTDSIRASLSSPLVAGNKVQILVDGPATFVAIDKAVAAATQSIHVETYIFADDEMGKKFAALLAAKRRQGVEVRVIYDAIGSIKSADQFFEDMKAQGIEVIKFRPLNPIKTWFWRFHNRDHRKIMVIDGRIAFTGGLNISDAYSSSSASKPGPEEGLKSGWRDTHVQIEGPAVEQFQNLFLETWRQLGGTIDGVPAAKKAGYFPKLAVQGSDLVSAVASSGLKEKDEAIYRTYLAAIKNSSRRIWITQAYLLPPEELTEALTSAVKRGIDVRIVVPGFSDSKLVLHASHSEYTDLLKAGIRLIESEDALLHAKTALIDDSVSIVGSANLDYRSFLHNNEVTAVIVGEDAAKRMHDVFLKDLAQGKELTLKEWQERSFWQRTEESFSRLLKFWL